MTTDERREEYRRKYNAYIAGEYLPNQWATIKRLKLEEQGYTCQVCGNDSRQYLHVHHRNYKRRFAERLSDLTVLCAACHKHHHGTNEIEHRAAGT